MKFAKIVFIAAGVWGIAVLTPLYFLFDVTGRAYTVPTDYPHFFYGFVGVGMAWQFAFLLIGSDPARYRLMMLPAMFEKFSYVVTLMVLSGQGRVANADAMAAVPDGLLGLLFVAAFVKARPVGRSTAAA